MTLRGSPGIPVSSVSFDFLRKTLGSEMDSNIKGIVGMIVPPPDMRAIIDRTAEFVSKHGPEMEKKIYSSDPTKIRFAFIMEDNPFHPYYTMAIRCYKEGRCDCVCVWPNW